MNRRSGFIFLGILFALLALLALGLTWWQIAKSGFDPTDLRFVLIGTISFVIINLLIRLPIGTIYWKQLKSVLLHKWYVLQAGRLTDVPLWRLLIHDWSKFTPVELVNYSRWKYSNKSKRGWAIAWLNHLHHNAHHPEHWVLSWRGNPEFYNNIASPIAPFVTLLPMPEIYVREMLADMMATSKQVTGSWDIANWLNQNGPGMHLHDETITIIDKVMKEIGYNLTENCDWSWVAGDDFLRWFTPASEYRL